MFDNAHFWVIKRHRTRLLEWHLAFKHKLQEHFWNYDTCSLWCNYIDLIFNGDHFPMDDIFLWKNSITGWILSCELFSDENLLYMIIIINNMILHILNTSRSWNGKYTVCRGDTNRSGSSGLTIIGNIAAWAS